MRRTPHLAAWILCALSCALPRAEEGTTSGPASTGAKPAEGVELIVDYLPPALYETEPLTACFRVENHAKIPATVRVRAEVRLEDGAWKLRDESKLEIASGARQTYQKDLDLAGAKAVRYVLKTGAGELPGPAVRLVRDEIPGPSRPQRTAGSWTARARRCCW
ncbi:MAG: hypothetical protein M5U26_02155 [Planctomycetota bacterium]|nr:hypothetical protein [Planctomycetota bacterium]